jgi:putative ABC transport system permease protein
VLPAPLGRTTRNAVTREIVTKERDGLPRTRFCLASRTAAHKTRSLLTVLGITIGISAVICVVAIGDSGQRRIEEQLNNLGDNFVWIEAGGRAINGVETGTHALPTSTMADAIAIKNQVPQIKKVSPNIDDPVQVIYGNQNWYTTYRGVSIKPS